MAAFQTHGPQTSRILNGILTAQALPGEGAPDVNLFIRLLQRHLERAPSRMRFPTGNRALERINTRAGAPERGYCAGGVSPHKATRRARSAGVASIADMSQRRAVPSQLDVASRSPLGK